MRPNADLETVFKLIRSKKYWFSAPSRSVNKVIEVYAASPTPKSASDAEAFILEGIFTLRNENFFKSGIQWGMVTDIYGLIHDGRHWYVKLGVQLEENESGDASEPWLQEISFHPPEKPFTTIGGIMIRTEV